MTLETSEVVELQGQLLLLEEGNEPLSLDPHVPPRPGSASIGSSASCSWGLFKNYLHL